MSSTRHKQCHRREVRTQQEQGRYRAPFPDHDQRDRNQAWTCLISPKRDDTTITVGHTTLPSQSTRDVIKSSDERLEIMRNHTPPYLRNTNYKTTSFSVLRSFVTEHDILRTLRSVSSVPSFLREIRNELRWFPHSQPKKNIGS